MSNILFVTSSIFGDKSKSREIGLDILTRLRAAVPGARVTMRDTNSVPHFSGELISALATPAEQRNQDQAKAVAIADTGPRRSAADSTTRATPLRKSASIGPVTCHGFWSDFSGFRPTHGSSG